MCGDLLTQLSSLQQTPIFLNECEGTTKVLKRKRLKAAMPVPVSFTGVF